VTLPNWYEIDQKRGSKFGALLGHRKKTRNISYYIPYTTAQKHFGKFTSCRTFGVHNLVHSEPFLDYLIPIRNFTLAVSAM